MSDFVAIARAETTRLCAISASESMTIGQRLQAARFLMVARGVELGKRSVLCLLRGVKTYFQYLEPDWAPTVAAEE
jgi:hypothetical protein